MKMNAVTIATNWNALCDLLCRVVSSRVHRLHLIVGIDALSSILAFSFLLFVLLSIALLAFLCCHFCCCHLPTAAVDIVSAHSQTCTTGGVALGDVTNSPPQKSKACKREQDHDHEHTNIPNKRRRTFLESSSLSLVTPPSAKDDSGTAALSRLLYKEPRDRHDDKAKRVTSSATNVVSISSKTKPKLDLCRLTKIKTAAHPASRAVAMPIIKRSLASLGNFYENIKGKFSRDLVILLPRKYESGTYRVVLKNSKTGQEKIKIGTAGNLFNRKQDYAADKDWILQEFRTLVRFDMIPKNVDKNRQVYYREMLDEVTTSDAVPSFQKFLFNAIGKGHGECLGVKKVIMRKMDEAAVQDYNGNKVSRVGNVGSRRAT